MRARLVSVRLIALIVTASCAGSLVSDARAQNRETLSIRGRNQSLRLYGTRGGTPVVVSSGDGGWIHLAPHVAEVLAAKGYFVVGFDVKAYLESFTSGKTTLRVEDEPSDYKVVADFGQMPDDARAGYRAAKSLGCFGCHGPGGLIGAKNPRSFKGYIPPWRGADFKDLVRDDAELKSWILDGKIDRLERNRAATFFTRRQQLKMPSYRGVAPDSTLATVMNYVKWVSTTQD